MDCNQNWIICNSILKSPIHTLNTLLGIGKYSVIRLQPACVLESEVSLNFQAGLTSGWPPLAEANPGNVLAQHDMVVIEPLNHPLLLLLVTWS